MPVLQDPDCNFGERTHKGQLIAVALVDADPIFTVVRLKLTVPLIVI